MRPVLLLGLSLFCGLATWAQSVPSEFELWNETQFFYPLKQGKDSKGKSVDEITVMLSGILRLGQKNVSVPVDSRAGLFLDFRVNKFAHVYAGYQYRTAEPLPGTRSYEQRLGGALGLEKTWKKFTFRERNMYEHLFRANRRDTDYYRQRGQIAYSFVKDDKELFAPFIADEGYYDIDLHRWIRNEFYVGIAKKFTGHFSMDIYYIRLDTLPVNANGIGTTLKFKLK